MYSVKDIANWFLYKVDRESGDSITHLKLQKLVYYTQAWSLVLNKSLFDENFEAWAHGPVVRSLFETYRDAGWEALGLPSEELIEFDKETEKIISDVWEIYGEHTGKYLEHLTHSEDPWIIARGDLSPEEKSASIIEKKSMENFYKKMYQDLSNG